MDAVLRSLVQAAIEAPSGENAQPWRFKMNNRSVYVYNNSSSDRSLYNFNNFGQLVCEGAALENMLIQADALGYEIALNMFPDPLDPECIARLDVGNAKQPSNADLAGVIPTRTTNRKPYKKTPVQPADMDAVRASVPFFEKTGLLFTWHADQKEMQALARVGSTNEEIMLGNQELHDFFFSHITWTKEEDAKKKLGFYIKTLELPPPIEGLFKIIQNWNVMKILKKVGFPAFVGTGNAGIYSSSAAIGTIAIPAITKENLVLAGRAFERIWITAAARGIHLQPLTGTMFMNIFAENVPEGHFSSAERALLKKRIGELRSVTGRTDSHVVVMYRMGYGDAPSARASRFALEDLLL